MTTSSATRSATKVLDLAELIGQVLDLFQTSTDKIDGRFVLTQSIRTYVSREFGISLARASLVVGTLQAMGLLGVVNLTTSGAGFMSEHQVLCLVGREHDLVAPGMTRRPTLYWVNMEADIISPDMIARITLPTASDNAAQRAADKAANKAWLSDVSFQKFRTAEIARLESKIQGGAYRVAKADLGIELTELKHANQVAKRDRRQAALDSATRRLDLLLEL